MIARMLNRPSGTWGLLPEDRPCAMIEGVQRLWDAVRRVRGGRIYNGVIPVSPSAAEDEFVPAIVVERCREAW